MGEAFTLPALPSKVPETANDRHLFLAVVASAKSAIVLIVKGGDCFIPSILFHNAALFHYDEGMQEWMERYKFQGDYRLRTCFNEEINSYFRQQSADYIIPVPLSEKNECKNEASTK